MEINFTNDELLIFNQISNSADECGTSAFIIGGFVRDKILNRPTKDADIVCIGDGIELAKKTAEKFSPKPHVIFFKNFGTAQIKIYSNEVSFEIEFVGARKESYNHDSRKPNIHPANLDEDRLRRDFTINTLAVSLNKNDFGKLIDPLNGFADIENKIIMNDLNNQSYHSYIYFFKFIIIMQLNRFLVR